jgi:hypothetical protein
MRNALPTTGRRLGLAAVAAVVLTFGAASPAQAAGDPTAADDQYGGVLGEQSGGQNQGGTLPFTGLDLVALVGAGAGLTAAGVGMRRQARRG